MPSSPNAGIFSKPDFSLHQLCLLITRQAVRSRTSFLVRRMQSKFLKEQDTGSSQSSTQAGFLNHHKESQRFHLPGWESPRNKGYSRLHSWSSFSGSKRSFCLFLDPAQQKMPGNQCSWGKGSKNAADRKQHRPKTSAL